MTQVERLSNLGYFAFKKEATKGTPVIPNTFGYLFKESMDLNPQIDESNPIAGTIHKVFEMYRGNRSFAGTLEVLAEPNTVQYYFDMMMTAGSITGGSDPYTHPFTISNATYPKSYTIEFLKGQVVCRCWGVEAESIEPSWDKNKMHLTLSTAALGMFTVRKIATISTTTITLDTTYEPVAPNKGLVATDLVRIMKADGSLTLDTTVSSVNVDGITVVLGASAASFAAGDFIFLRAQTPTYTVLTPFLWSRTQFCFADTAANALSATHTPVEVGSKWKLMYNFENKEGAHRSGSFDPASLVRLQADAGANVKLFFDYPDKYEQFQRLNFSALVIRHYSDTNHELRITLNAIAPKTNKMPLEAGKIIYQDFDYGTKYNQTDGQAFDVKVINALSS